MILFTDLDGTIIQTKSGNTFPVDKNDWEFVPGILDQLVRFWVKNRPDQLIIITNQGGVNEGYHRPMDVYKRLEEIVANIKIYFKWNDLKIEIDTVVAPSLSSPHRKPFKDPFNTKGWMIGNASGIGYLYPLEEEELTPTIKKKAREAWKKNEVTFRVKNQHYKVNYCLKEEAHLTINSETLYREGDNHLKISKFRDDHSNSDKEHAILNNLIYYDVEEFLSFSFDESALSNHIFSTRI